MKSTGWRCMLLGLAAFLACGSEEVQAQINSSSGASPPSMRRNRNSPLSPYLNLAAAGGNTDAATANYFLITRPQQNAQRFRSEQNRQNRTLQQELAAQQELLQSPTSMLGSTGHSVGFMNYGGYYNFPNSRQGGQRSGGMARPRSSGLPVSMPSVPSVDVPELRSPYASINQNVLNGRAYGR